MTSTMKLGLGLAAAMLSLAACTPPAASVTATATVTAAPSATGAPASTPTPAATPTPGTTTPAPTVTTVADYDFTRYEFMHAGDRYSDYAGRSDVTISPLAPCPWVADVTVPGQDPNVTVGWNADQVAPTGTARIFTMYGDVDTVARFSPPLNAEGIGIGTPLSTVLATYPGSATHIETNSGYGSSIHQVRVDDPASDGRYYFWAYSDTGRIFRIDFGLFPTDAYWPNGWDCVD